MEPENDALQGIETEIRTIDTLLRQGVRVTLPAPWWLRCMGKKNVSLIVRMPDNETMLRISRLYLKMKQKATTLEAETIGEAHQIVAECMIPASRIIAYAVKPYVTPLGLRNRLLARYIRRHTNAREMAELWMIVVGMAGPHDFCNTIRSMSGMRTTKPRTTTT